MTMQSGIKFVVNWLVFYWVLLEGACHTFILLCANMAIACFPCLSTWLLSLPFQNTFGSKSNYLVLLFARKCDQWHWNLATFFKIITRFFLPASTRKIASICPKCHRALSLLFLCFVNTPIHHLIVNLCPHHP